LQNDPGSAIGKALRAPLEDIDLPADLPKQDSRGQPGKGAAYATR
jgi:hypothetical protein